MTSILVATVLALVLSLAGTPLVIRWLSRHGYGQEIREDGPSSHVSKRGTPTMGGVVIIGATVLGYAGAHLAQQTGPTASGLLVLLVMIGLGAVGAADDLIKIYRQRSLGLNARAKFVAQLAVAVLFGVLALRFRNSAGLTPASDHISVVRDTSIAIGAVLFVGLAYVVISGTSNAVNLTDGLDGLAGGTSAMVFAAYVGVSFMKFRHSCGASPGAGCYETRDPLDVAVLASAALGACLGFLWFNAPKAKIFMGDTGSLGLGGAFAAIAMVTRTELLLVLLGGLFVAETLSVIIQVGVFKARKGKRVFRMAPVHHHFELLGWPEVTVIVRFWIIAAILIALGLGLFYAEYLAKVKGT